MFWPFLLIVATVACLLLVDCVVKTQNIYQIDYKLKCIVYICFGLMTNAAGTDNKRAHTLTKHMLKSMQTKHVFGHVVFVIHIIFEFSSSNLFCQAEIMPNIRFWYNLS